MSRPKVERFTVGIIGERQPRFVCDAGEVAALEATYEELEREVAALAKAANEQEDGKEYNASLVVERDARIEALRAALREQVILDGIDEEGPFHRCALCEQAWPKGQPEIHADGCLGR